MCPEALALQYRERSAPPELATHIANVWSFRIVSLGVEGYDHHPPPDGCASLVVRYHEDPTVPVSVLFADPRAKAYRVRIKTRDTYYGLRFWPHAARAVLGEALETASEFVGPARHVVPELAARLAADLPGSHAVGVVEPVLLAAAGDLIARAQAVDVLVQRAVEAIVRSRGTAPIATIADGLDISLRQLQRRFRAGCGLTLKQFARFRRFRNAALALLDDEPRRWVDVAYDAGYADQAHLSREFTDLIGLTAEELRSRVGATVSDVELPS